MNKIPREFTGVVPKYDAQTAAQWTAVLKGMGSVTIPAGQTHTIELNAGEEMCSNGMDPVKKNRCDWVNGYYFRGKS